MPALFRLDKYRILFRSFFIQATWNSERMQSLGYCFCLVPFAKKLLRSNSERIDFLTKSLEFFNTHPYMANWILGAAMKIQEQERESPRSDSKQIDRFKKRMSESLGAIGDQMFWCLIKPISAMLGVLFALYLGLVGLTVFFVCYNFPHVFVRIKGLVQGYREGFRITEMVSMSRYKPLIDRLNKVGGILVGVLLVLTVDSEYVFDFLDLVGLLAGMGLMHFLLIRKVSVPLALITVMLIAGFASTLVASW